MGGSLVVKTSTISYTLNDYTSECKVRFSVEFDKPDGWDLKVSGPDKVLGYWRPSEAIILQRKSFIWEAEITLTTKTLDYRYIIVHRQKDHVKIEENIRVLTYPKLREFVILEDNQKVIFSQDYNHGLLEVSFKKKIPQWLSIYIIGNTPDLGNMNLENGLKLKYEADSWTGRFPIKTTNIMNQRIEYHYFIVDTQTTSYKECVKEVGNKHVLSYNHDDLTYIEAEYLQFEQKPETPYFEKYLKPKYNFLIKIGKTKL